MESGKTDKPLDFELQCLFGHKHYTCGVRMIQACVLGDESIFVVYECALRHGYGEVYRGLSLSSSFALCLSVCPCGAVHPRL